MKTAYPAVQNLYPKDPKHNNVPPDSLGRRLQKDSSQVYTQSQWDKNENSAKFIYMKSLKHVKCYIIYNIDAGLIWVYLNN